VWGEGVGQTQPRPGYRSTTEGHRVVGWVVGGGDGGLNTLPARCFAILHYDN